MVSTLCSAHAEPVEAGNPRPTKRSTHRSQNPPPGSAVLTAGNWRRACMAAGDLWAGCGALNRNTPSRLAERRVNREIWAATPRADRPAQRAQVRAELVDHRGPKAP